MIKEEQKKTRMRPEFTAVLIVLIIFVLSVSAFAAVKILSKGKETAEETETVTETTTELDTRDIRALPYDDLDYEKVDEYVLKVYDNPYTTKTPLSLKQEADVDSLAGWGKLKQYGGVMQYYDPAYELKPVEYNYKTVIYKPPYVRYFIQGYPAFAAPGDFVTHVEICGVDDVYICGINVNSTFEEFEETFSALGFTVTRESVKTTYGEREIIKADIDGFWIILEAPSQLKLQKGVYGYYNAIEYENNVVPTILRMGLAVNHVSRIEQFMLP